MSVQIIKQQEGSNFFDLSIGDLETILLKPDLKDREVVVVSIAGAFRKGKSFLLNFFLRYLSETYVTRNLNGNWLGGDNDDLEGFSWRNGSSPCTTGIHMWSNIYLQDFEDGPKVCIILLDTQGTFDSKSTMKQCSAIFALSTLLSSVQIYNLMHNIQEDDLQHLQLFSEFGRLAAGTLVDQQPFQKLVFLVRDWSCPYEFEYGEHGGQELLHSRLMIHVNQDRELSSLRNHIKMLFSHVRCFLLPNPGARVTTAQNFKGKLSDIEKDFIDNLLVLVPLLLAPDNLISKKINGEAVKAHEWVELFKKYFDIFKNGNLPQARTIFEATATVHNTNAVRDGEALYSSRMTTFCGESIRQNPQDLRREHNNVKREAFAIFNAKRPMGDSEFLKEFMVMLNEFIEQQFKELLQRNEGKVSWVKLGALVAMIIAGPFMPALLEHPMVPATVAPFLKYVLQFLKKTPKLQ